MRQPAASTVTPRCGWHTARGRAAPASVANSSSATRARRRTGDPPAAFEGWGPARNASLEAALLEPTLHSGHSRRSAQRLLLHYTPALAARAAELYAADVSRFGYARDVAAFSVRLGAFRSCLGLKSGAAPVDEMLHGGGRPRWSAARIGDCAANASR